MCVTKLTCKESTTVAKCTKQNQKCVIGDFGGRCFIQVFTAEWRISNARICWLPATAPEIHRKRHLQKTQCFDSNVLLKSAKMVFICLRIFFWISQLQMHQESTSSVWKHGERRTLLHCDPAAMKNSQKWKCILEKRTERTKNSRKILELCKRILGFPVERWWRFFWCSGISLHVYLVNDLPQTQAMLGINIASKFTWLTRQGFCFLRKNDRNIRTLAKFCEWKTSRKSSLEIFERFLCVENQVQFFVHRLSHNKAPHLA